MLRILLSNAGASVMGPAIFIDRDGVINCRRPDDYVLNFSQFLFVPGIRAALKQLADLGLPMIIISNQAAVGKGLLDRAGLEDITVRMHDILRADGAPFAAAYYCIHRSDENCVCRKPRPELLYRAASDFNIDLSRSVFIGDSETDVQAARAAGCQPILFGPGLCPSSTSSCWMANLAIALKTEDIFETAVKYLHSAGAGRGCPPPYDAKED